MKTTVVCLVILAVFAIVLPADGAEKETELEFDKAKLWNLAGLPAYFFLENFLHESSHALAAKSFGGEVYSFKPYPHRTTDGVFLMGGFTLAGKELSKRENATVAIAPYLTDAALFISTDLLLSYGAVNPKSAGGLILYSVGMLAPLVNFVYNAHGFGKYNDFVRFSQDTGVNRYTLLVITEGLSFIAAYRLIAQGLNVFFDEVKVDAPAVTLAPFFKNGATGLSLLSAF